MSCSQDGVRGGGVCDTRVRDAGVSARLLGTAETSTWRENPVSSPRLPGAFDSYIFRVCFPGLLFKPKW